MAGTKPFEFTPWERNHLPAAVLKILKGHVGRHNAIVGKDLAASLFPLQRDDRKVRLAIRELLREGHPIASSVGEPMGFYMCANEHEAMAYIATLKSRAEEDLARLKDFEKAAATRWSIPKQESLF